MFNSSVLDIAVGLIFVYLLLGLICTTVNEWLAQLFKTRAATLKEGIRRLLHAPPDGTYLIRAVDINVAPLAARLSKPDDKLTKAVGAFDPAVQSQIDAFALASKDKPASQPPDGLAAALAGKLSGLLSQPSLNQSIDCGKVTPETMAEAGKQLKGVDLLRVNRALLNEAYPDEISSLSDAFYSHPLIKSLARPGRHPSYIPSKTFATTLLDIFAKGKAAEGTAEERLDQIKASIGNLPDSDVKRSLQALLMNGSDSVDQVEKKLSSWFDDSMDRVSGWYKNRVQVWTVVIACLVTIMANADTIRIAQKLMINPALRDKIVQEAKNVKDPSQGSTDSGQPTLTAAQKADLSSLSGWTEEFLTFHRLEACADAKLRGAQTETDCRKQSDAQAKKNPDPKFIAAWSDNAFPGLDLASPIFIPWLWAVVPGHLTGWILTAIAASLGAPFWFDTLNKFMNVRAVGTAPNEKNSDKSKT